MQCVNIAGVPGGDTAVGLAEWRVRYPVRLRRIREVTTIDRGLAVRAAVQLAWRIISCVHCRMIDLQSNTDGEWMWTGDEIRC